MIMLAPFVGKHILLGFSFLFCGVFCLASTACIEFAGGNDGKIFCLDNLFKIKVLYAFTKSIKKTGYDVFRIFILFA